MAKNISIGVIGDFNPDYKLHSDTNISFSYAAKKLGVKVDVRWIPTASLVDEVGYELGDFDAILCAPGSPYKSMDGALNGIRFAREAKLPFLGTCGGFQYAVIEFARNVIGRNDADHAEEHPDASSLFVTRLSCSLAGKTQKIRLVKGSLAYLIYGSEITTEHFFCSFGLNATYRQEVEASGLRASGFDENGEVRLMELIGARFYIITLFVPQACPEESKLHPLVLSFVEAAASK